MKSKLQWSRIHLSPSDIVKLLLFIASIISYFLIVYLLNDYWLYIKYKPSKNEFWPSHVVVKKPIIYIYGYTGEVKILLKSKYELVDPKPPFNLTLGWRVFTQKDSVFYEGEKIPYLFYEIKLQKAVLHELIKNKPIIATISKDNIQTQLLAIFIQVGMTLPEAKDLASYWTPRLQKMQSDNISIRLLNTEDINKLVGLDVTPRPKRTIRLFFVFSPSKREDHKEYTPYNVPQIIKKDLRKQYSVIEYGGVILSYEAPSE